MKENNGEQLPVGQYLFVGCNEGDPVPILFSEFDGRCAQAKRTAGVRLTNPGAGNGMSNENITEKNLGPNLQSVVSFVAERISLSDSDFGDGSELIIESGFSDFLELPWEKISAKRIFVLRKVVTGERLDPPSSNSLLLVASYSNERRTEKLKDLKNKIIIEIIDIVKYALEALPKQLHISNISISKHTTIEKFGALAWDDYNIVHIMMHGDEGGGFCLEASDINQYNEVDILEDWEIIHILQGKKFLLFFVSSCYSGGGAVNKSSLAFEIVSKGIARYAIGYRYGVGEDSAGIFAKLFYESLVSGKDFERLEEVYKESLRRYYDNPQADKDYVPILFMNA